MKKLSKKRQRKERNNLTVYQLNVRTSIDFRKKRAARIKKEQEQ